MKYTLDIFVVKKSGFGQHVALVNQFFDSDDATFARRGVTVHLDRLADYSRHVVYSVLAGEKTYAALDQAVDATGVIVAFKQQP
jgi:hypothetical protein